GSDDSPRWGPTLERRRRPRCGSWLPRVSLRRGLGGLLEGARRSWRLDDGGAGRCHLPGAPATPHARRSDASGGSLRRRGCSRSRPPHGRPRHRPRQRPRHRFDPGAIRRGGNRPGLRADEHRLLPARSWCSRPRHGRGAGRGGRGGRVRRGRRDPRRHPSRRHRRGVPGSGIDPGGSGGSVTAEVRSLRPGRYAPTMRKTSAILGFGGYVPERIVTNRDWEEMVDTTDEWIVTRTGIRERRFAADDEATADLAEKAARVAMEDAGVEAGDIDEIIVATDTPEVYTPDTAAFLQDRLGTRSIPAYDLGGSGCAGWLQAIDVARARIALQPKRILVVGVELISRIISWKERDTCVLFGDGAGAVVMGPEGGSARLLDVVSGTDGSRAEILTLSTGGTRHPFNQEAVTSGAYNRLTMHGREVFREAVRRMSDAAREILERIGASLADVALVVPHQANQRIIDAVGKELGVEPDRMYSNIASYGNIGSATVPFA